MNIKLHNDKTLEVQEPTEHDQIEYLSMLDDYEKTVKEKGELTAQKQAIVFQNKMLAKLSKQSMEEVQKMALIDKSKAIEAIKTRFTVLGRANQNLDF